MFLLNTDIRPSRESSARPTVTKRSRTKCTRRRTRNLSQKEDSVIGKREINLQFRNKSLRWIDAIDFLVACQTDSGSGQDIRIRKEGQERGSRFRQRSCLPLRLRSFSLRFGRRECRVRTREFRSFRWSNWLAEQRLMAFTFAYPPGTAARIRNRAISRMRRDATLLVQVVLLP